MEYSISNGQIIINNAEHFDPKSIIECGQVFRYQKIESGYKIFSKNLFCSLIYTKDRAIIVSDCLPYFIDYFDLNRDYGDIESALSGYRNLGNAVSYGKGLRILKQDPFETLISFIVSANNNIPRIQGIIERLCAACGENMGDYFAFPTAERLAAKDADFFYKLGAGYRAEYIADTSQKIANGFSLDLSGMSTPEARQRLISLKGVGRKVADCVLLFGYGRKDVFPTDTWIEKVYAERYGENGKDAAKMADRLSGEFGELSGYAQQYLYNYARNHK